MTHPKPVYSGDQYFPAFDWLRLTLAMIVALSHDAATLDENAANFAVRVFFALSGWLIGGILLNSERKDMPRFYFNRAARIWTPYYFAVALVFAVSLLKEPLDRNWLEYLFYDLTYTHNWFITPRILEIANDLPLQGTTNHFWSLSVEEQFYLFAPLLIVFTRWGRSLWVWAAIAAVAIAIKIWYAPIALGVVAVIAKEKFGDWHLRPAARIALGAVLAVCVAVYVSERSLYGYIAPIAATPIVLLLAWSGGKTKLGAFVGGISYPLYLNHWVGIFMAHEVVQRFPIFDGAAGIILGGALNIAVASLLYVAIDEQVRKRRSKVFTQGRGKAAAIFAYSLIIIGAVGGFIFMALRA